MTHTREDAQALIATDQAQLLLSGLWDDYCEAGTANGSTDNGAIELYDIDGMADAVRILLTRVAAEGGLAAGLTADPDAHDVWFRAKVQEALADQQPAKPHDQVMREARALIDGKRRA